MAVAARATRRTRILFRPWVLATIVAGLFALPLPALLGWEQDFVNNSLLFSMTQMFMLIVLTSDWNLTSGFTGYVDFGHPVFFGLGAYSVGILMAKSGWGFWPALVMAGIVASLFALLIGIPTLRLKGPYFSIAMLGTFVAVGEIIRVARGISGGGTGLTLPPYLNRPLFYYVTLILAVLVVAMMWKIRHSEFGASLIAIREDEVGAEMRGIDTTVHKVTAFMIAAFPSGLVGGMWAYQNTFIDPDVVFFESRVVEYVMMGILGGLGTVAGPVIGAATVYWLRDVLWANFLQFHLIAEGALLIAIVLFAPTGIMGFLGHPDAFNFQRLLTRWLPRREEEAPG